VTALVAEIGTDVLCYLDLEEERMVVTNFSEQGLPIETTL